MWWESDAALPPLHAFLPQTWTQCKLLRSKILLSTNKITWFDLGGPSFNKYRLSWEGSRGIESLSILLPTSTKLIRQLLTWNIHDAGDVHARLLKYVCKILPESRNLRPYPLWRSRASTVHIHAIWRRPKNMHRKRVCAHWDAHLFASCCLEVSVWHGRPQWEDSPHRRSVSGDGERVSAQGAPQVSLRRWWYSSKSQSRWNPVGL